MKKQPKNKAIAIFEGNQIRRNWDDEKELWYFSVVDVARVLTNSVDAGAYWRKLKQRLKEEGSEVVTKCHELKFMAKDGKYYLTDAVDTETILRLIQSNKREPKNFDENRTVAREGGTVAGNARKEIEVKTGKKIITNKNAKTLYAKKDPKKLK